MCTTDGLEKKVGIVADWLRSMNYEIEAIDTAKEEGGNNAVTFVSHKYFCTILIYEDNINFYTSHIINRDYKNIAKCLKLNSTYRWVKFGILYDTNGDTYLTAQADFFVDYERAHAEEDFRRALIIWDMVFINMK